MTSAGECLQALGSVIKTSSRFKNTFSRFKNSLLVFLTCAHAHMCVVLEDGDGASRRLQGGYSTMYQTIIISYEAAVATAASRAPINAVNANAISQILLEV
jgi:hypothetical protein